MGLEIFYPANHLAWYWRNCA